MKASDRLRAIFKNAKLTNPVAMKWRVYIRIDGQTYQIRACSDKEAVYIRYRIEKMLGESKRRGNYTWEEFCIPDPIDYCSVESGYLTVCKRTFRMLDRWTEEKALAVSAAAWFSYCWKPPHACIAGIRKEDPSFVARVPLKAIVGRISECKRRR